MGVVVMVGLVAMGFSLSLCVHIGMCHAYPGEVSIPMHTPAPFLQRVDGA